MLKILHLSDLHIGETYDFTGLIQQKVIYSLKKANEGNIDIIIVTGDIFDRPSEDEKSSEKIETNGKLKPKDKLKKALTFFNNLLNDIKTLPGSDKLTKEDILFVPGNHDLSRNETDETWNLYIDFLAKFYGSVLYDRLYNSKLMVIKEDKNKKFLFLGLNSNYFDKTGEEYKECIDYEQLNYVDSLFGFDKSNENNKYSDYYKIAFFHHPFYIFPENVMDEKKGTLSNLTEFNKKLTEWEIKLVLHGHKHLGGITTIKENGTRIKAIAAGALGYYGSQEHSFNIITIDDEYKLNLKKYVSKSNHIFKFDRNVKLKNNHKSGMLREIYHTLMDSTENPSRTRILKMLNELYLQRDALSLLYNENNKKLLRFSIEYRIQFRRYFSLTPEQLSEQIDNFKKGYFEEVKNSFPSTFQIIDLLNCKNNSEIFEKIKDIEIEEELEKAENIINKRNYSFILLAMFFTDLYLEFTDFWKNNLMKFAQCMTNASVDYDSSKIKFSGSGIKYNLKHKIIYIKILCNNMNSQKCAAELIKNCRRHFLNIQPYFNCLKLNINDILPKFEYENDKNKYCKIDAFVPTLIRLLSGKNIYASDLAFVRELIQNSIDAISFRKLLDDSEAKFSSDINIELKKTDSENIFQIRDYGIGMNKETIEQYFTILGKSYYKEYNFIEDGNLEYNPISNFGIGFLSVIRPCKKIIIKTKHFVENIFYQLEIEQDQDYFFITTTKEEFFEIGTEITCYLKDNSDSQIFDTIHNYIEERMLDIKYNINICRNDENAAKTVPDIISAKSAKTGKDLPFIYIPFREEDNSVINLNEITPESLLKHDYGLLIRSTNPELKNNGREKILNAGILMENAKLEEIISDLPEDIRRPKLNYTEIILNFPPNWLRLDVSREKVESKNGKKFPSLFPNNVYKYFRTQMEQYISEHKEASLAVILEAEKYMNNFFNSGSETGKTIKLTIAFGNNEISYSLTREHTNKYPDFTIIHTNNPDDISSKIEGIQIYEKLKRRFQDKLIQSDFYQKVVNILDANNTENNNQTVTYCLNALGLSWSETDYTKYFPVILAACLVHKNTLDGEDLDSDQNIDSRIKKKILELCTINDLDLTDWISVKYGTTGIEKIEMSSDLLEDRIKRIAKDYGADNEIKKYDFIWNNIIINTYKGTNIDYWKNQIANVQTEYEYLKDTIKDLYTQKDPESQNMELKINIYQIASCYMGALFNLLKKDSLDNNTLSECEWIWNCGLKLLYMWTLSEYKPCPDNHFPDEEKYNRLITNTEKIFECPGNKKRAYIKMLELKLLYSERFDILCFSELLHWIADYNKNELSKINNDTQK